MSAECQRCGAKCELFLCNECMGTLQKLLTDMPWWLDRLAETSIGQAKLGDSGGRAANRGATLRGDDDALTKCKCGHSEHEIVACREVDVEIVETPTGALDDDGDEIIERVRHERTCTCDEYVPAVMHAKLVARLLAQGRVNARASDLFDEVQNMLGSWVRDVCERRGVYWVDPRFIGPLRANEERFALGTASAMAIWLHERVSALSSAECAGESFSDIKSATERIERAVNKPPEPKTCGPCPTPGEHTSKGFEMKDVRTRCGTRLEARANAVDVRCPVCKQTHNVEVLTTRLTNDMHYMSFTIRQLLDVVLPRAETPVPRRTLYHWVAKGKLKATGEDTDGTPKYLLADVRKLRSESSRKQSA